MHTPRDYFPKELAQSLSRIIPEKWMAFEKEKENKRKMFFKYWTQLPGFLEKVNGI